MSMVKHINIPQLVSSE